MRYLVGLLFLVLVLWLLTGVTMIYPGELAVVQRFGRILADKPGPGLYLGCPWGIDRIARVQVELRRPVAVGFNPNAEDTGATPAGQLLTGDHNLVNVSLVLNYVVVPGEVDRFVLYAEEVDGLLERVTESALAEWVAARTVDEVLLHGKSDMPEFIVAEAQQRLRPYQLGLEVRDVRVTHLFPPAEVKESFDTVARTQTAIRTQKYAAEEDSTRKLAQVDAEGFALRRQADAHALAQRLSAEAEAITFSRSVEQYHALRDGNPRYLEGLWYDRFSPVLARMRSEKRLQALDHYLGGRAVDITQVPPWPAKK